ncbi:MAG TPA: hypothetical protein VF736_18465 [Pyrinomonadaceae bacterium]
MEQFLSRFTLSFLMAQLFPGAVAVLSCTCPYAAKLEPRPATMLALFTSVGDLWFGSFRNTVIFLFLSGAAGLLIHGISWSVMAWLENHDPSSPPVAKSVRESFWHDKRIIFQVVLAPVKMVLELLGALSAPKLEVLRMEENVSGIRPEDKPAFDFLEDFYLYFAEFYAHTAYALLFGFPFVFWTWVVLGFTPRRAALLVLFYLGAGVFFLIGRVQYITLFNAEVTLVERAQRPTSP